MNKEKIARAKSEAKRFLAAVSDVEKRDDRYTWIVGNATTGALRRASLDLTRALAEMRKPA